MIGTLSILLMLASLESRILDCAGITADIERLRCFDALGSVVAAARAETQAATPAAPPAASQAAVAPQSAAAAAPQANSASASVLQTSPGVGAERDFGLTGAQLEERDGQDGVDAVEEIESRVAEVLSSRSGKHSYRLENGQLWRQVESTSLPQIKAGETMVIRRAAFGSYLASGRQSGRPPVRVRRQE